MSCGYCGRADVYERGGNYYNPGDTEHDCADEMKAEIEKLKAHALRDEVALCDQEALLEAANLQLSEAKKVLKEISENEKNPHATVQGLAFLAERFLRKDGCAICSETIRHCHCRGTNHDAACWRVA